MVFAGLDFGAKRIGIAVTDAAGIGVYPLAIVRRTALVTDLDEITRLFADRAVGHAIVGLPLNMDGSPSAMTRAASSFAAILAEKLGITVELFDERLTSFEARERLRHRPAGFYQRSARVDALAAAIILESWLRNRECNS